jgi:hypothetical protein
MKATIDIPDDIYRQVKAKCAIQGRTIRDATIELFEAWLHADEGAHSTQKEPKKRHRK